VAATAFTLIAPAFARGRFPRLLLSDVVLKRLSMDTAEATALALLCGETIVPEFNAGPFIRHLDEVVDRTEIRPFFGHFPDRPASWGINVRLLGVDWETEDWDKEALTEWRRAYTNLPSALQMFVVTLLWLYHGRGEDNQWLLRLPHKWHIAEALPALKAAGLLGDWAKLVVTYQGW